MTTAGSQAGYAGQAIKKEAPAKSFDIERNVNTGQE
jgi:hypothetical protein